jgi:predicted PhzF superfamily epimerase YddE/YHI9
MAYRAAQGVEIQRPSVLSARCEKREGAVAGVWIAGHCVMVSQGRIEVG